MDPPLAVNHDGRFAPSPSGPLHAGNLRTALVAWMRARSKGARFLLRIEDLDPQRSKPEHERAQIEDLRAVGIDWDGEPVRQSERHDLYAEALAELERQGRVYPCWCTRAEIREAAQAPHGPLPEGAYPGTCRELTGAQRAERGRETRPAACASPLDARSGSVVRLRPAPPRWRLGLQPRGDRGRRRPGIGEVVRGEDLLETTPRQLLIADLLSLPKPAYVHVPLVTDDEGKRLAKRDEPGIEPAVIDRIRAEAEAMVRRLDP